MVQLTSTNTVADYRAGSIGLEAYLSPPRPVQIGIASADKALTAIASRSGSGSAAALSSWA